MPAIAWIGDDGRTLTLQSLQASGPLMGQVVLKAASDATPWSSPWLQGTAAPIQVGLGYLVAVPEGHPRILDVPAHDGPGVTASFGGDSALVKSMYWCDETYQCPSDDVECSTSEERCYIEEWTCGDWRETDCVRLDTRGDAWRRNPWSELHGLVTDYLVVYLHEDAEPGALSPIGILDGPYERGYHIFRVEDVRGESRREAEACWQRAEQRSVEIVNEVHHTRYSIEDFAEHNSNDEYGFFRGTAAQVGLMEFHCARRLQSYVAVEQDEIIPFALGRDHWPRFQAPTIYEYPRDAPYRPTFVTDAPADQTE